MAINFPSSPSVDDTYTYLTNTWVWNGTGWIISSATETGNTEGNTGEVAYYDVKGSVIKGATAFLYEPATQRVALRGGLSANAGATFANDIVVNGDITVGGATLPNIGQNTVLGTNAMGDMGTSTTHHFNVAVGHYALEKCQGAIQGTAIGWYAGSGNSGGAANTSIGYYSAKSNEGDFNTGVGARSLQASTNASYNTALGSNSLFSNITGGYNTSVGKDSLYKNTAGQYNTAMGYQTLYNNQYNIVPGAGGHTLQAPPFGEYNTAIGAESMYTNVTGGSNTALGYQTLYSTERANYNTAIGYRALYKNTQGDFNTAVGKNCLDELHADDKTSPTDWPNYNTAIGVSAGKGLVYGDNNIYIGYNAQGTTLSASNEIVLGDNNVSILHTAAGISAAYFRFPDGTTLGSTQTDTIGINVSNGSQVLTTGTKGHRTIPYNCEIVDWRVTSTDSGAIEWGINYCTYANFPTMTANAIHIAESPGIAASGYKDESGGQINLRWTKYQFDAGDIIQFDIDSVASLTNCIIELTIRRNG